MMLFLQQLLLLLQRRAVAEDQNNQPSSFHLNQIDLKGVFKKQNIKCFVLFLMKEFKGSHAQITQLYSTLLSGQLSHFIEQLIKNIQFDVNKLQKLTHQLNGKICGFKFQYLFLFYFIGRYIIKLYFKIRLWIFQKGSQFVINSKLFSNRLKNNLYI